MKSKFTFLLFYLICFQISNTHAQKIIEPGNYFTAFFEKGSQVNPYFLSGNPAFLHFDYGDELLGINTIIKNNTGGFKTFRDPGTNSDYQLSFSGKKVLDDIQVFKGAFAVQRNERKNWDFIVTRNNESTNPFLLGDSTSGNYRYNGILLNAEYAVKLSQKIIAGFGFNYGVDEGLKEVSPRPTSTYRDIDAEIGMGYLFTDEIGIGASIRVYDFNEELKYREDEGAVFQETVLFKFRGYDYPLRITKKVETRLSYQNGYFGGLDIFYIKDKFKLAGNFGGGFEHLIVKDDVLNPQLEGYWKNNKYFGGLKASLQISKKATASIVYSLNINDAWAKHPNFDVLLSQNKSASNLFLGGVEFKLTDNTSVGAEIGTDIFSREETDFYSDIEWKGSGAKIFSKLGISTQLSKHAVVTAGLGFGSQNLSDAELNLNNPTVYFTDYRCADIHFYQTEFTEYSAFIKAAIYPASIGNLNFYFIYDRLVPRGSGFFDGEFRSNFSGALELRLNVY